MNRRWLLNPIVHELADLLHYVGMRDRLRCPDCRAVGTFKPHGATRDVRVGDVRGARRWLCKYCGWYIGPEGVKQCYPDIGVTDVWQLEGNTNNDSTPKDILMWNIGGVDPWRG